MRKTVFSFLLLTALAVSATSVGKPPGRPATSFYEIREIIDLYRDGQYNIVKAKLANQGFKIISTEPDYTLHGTAHEGTFKMEYETDSPSDQLREYGIKLTSFYYFSTEKFGKAITSNITIELPSYESRYIYNAFNNGYNSERLEQDNNCSSDNSCIHFWGQMGQTNSFKDFIEATLNCTSNSTKESSGKTTDYLVFRGNLNFKHIKQEVTNIKPAIRTTVTKIRHKEQLLN